MSDLERLGAGRIEGRELEQEMRSSFLDYAMSVIVSRALPDVRDGCARSELGDSLDRQRWGARLRIGVRIERRQDMRVHERHRECRSEDADDRVRLAVNDER